MLPLDPHACLVMVITVKKDVICKSAPIQMQFPYKVVSTNHQLAGADYEPVTRTLTFTPSSASELVRVTLFDDLSSEGLEEFSVELVLVDETLGEPGVVREAMVIIADNESEFHNYFSHKNSN